MDVSNASGYDGSTVAADACYVARGATRRTKVVVAETLNPQVRQVVRTFAPGFGMEVVEVPHTTAAPPIPRRSAAAAEDAACVIFQQPNFFGCLEPAPGIAAAAAAAGALPVAHVDLLSLGVLEAPGDYGCALAIGEGQSAGNHSALRRPALRLHGREGASTSAGCPAGSWARPHDLTGERGYVLTLQTREQHIRREKATSNITTNQTLLALAGLAYLSLARAGGAARHRAGLPGARRGAPSGPSACRAAFDRPTFKEFALRPRPAGARSRAGGPKAGRPSRLPARARLPRHGERCSSWPSPRSARGPTSSGWRRCSRGAA